MSSQLKSAQNFFILCLGAGLIGLAPLFVRWSELSPSWNLFYRMFLALPFLAILNFYYNGSHAFKLKSRKHLLLALIASLAFAADMSAWHWSLQFTSVANSTILVNTAPIYMVIFASFAVLFVLFLPSFRHHGDGGISCQGIPGIRPHFLALGSHCWRIDPEKNPRLWMSDSS